MSQPKEVEERVDGGKDKGDNGSSSTDASKWALLCFVSHVSKLKSTCKDKGNKLIENDGVEIEIWSSMKSNLKMPENIAIQSSFSWYAFCCYYVHEKKVDHEDSKC